MQWEAKGTDLNNIHLHGGVSRWSDEGQELRVVAHAAEAATLCVAAFFSSDSPRIAVSPGATIEDPERGSS